MLFTAPTTPGVEELHVTPFVVRRMRPFAPPIHASVELRTATVSSASLSTGADCTLQELPPLTVFRIVALSPTAQPTFASAKSTPYSLTPLGEACDVQVAPESIVFRMSPLSPTIQPVVGLTNRTACRAVV